MIVGIVTDITFIIRNVEEAEGFYLSATNGILAPFPKVIIRLITDDPKAANLIAAGLGLSYLEKGRAEWYGDNVSGKVIMKRSETLSYKEVDVVWETL